MDEKFNYERQGSDVFKGMAAGVIGGFAGAIAMNQFQALLGKLSEKSDDSKSQRQQGHQEQGGGKDRQPQQDKEQELATVKTAEAISEGVFDHDLTEREKKYAGPAVHYAMGITSGAIYGAAAELAPMSTSAAGLPFGAAVWLVADEEAVPAFGLSKSPLEYPASTHAYALASHLVYGLTTEFARRAVRGVM